MWQPGAFFRLPPKSSPIFHHSRPDLTPHSPPSSVTIPDFLSQWPLKSESALLSHPHSLCSRQLSMAYSQRESVDPMAGSLNGMGGRERWCVCIPVSKILRIGSVLPEGMDQGRNCPMRRDRPPGSALERPMPGAGKPDAGVHRVCAACVKVPVIK